ncbi:MAG: aminotransferase class V-fold PLP-dependent enzyme [Actinomycetota bacterium]
MVSTAYLDHAATTPIRPAAIEAIHTILDAPAGNPSGAHRAAQRARRRLDESRDAVAALAGRSPSEVYFTSGGTEADDLAVAGYAGRGVVVCPATEHHAVLDPVLRAGGRVVPVDRTGAVRLDALADALDGDVALVSVMAANNETGRVADLAAVAAVVRDRAPGAALHTDAVQAAGWLDLGELAADADLVSVTGHKLGGPMGSGALLVRRDREPAARIIGGGQERDLRSGTPNLPGAVGFGAGAAEVVATRSATAATVAALRDRLEDAILDELDGVETTVARADRLPGICHLVIDGVEAESVIVLLDEAGVSASAASSCASGATRASHVLTAMGADLAARSTLRLSLGWCSTAADVDRVLDALPPIVKRLREHRRRAA